MSAPRQIDGRDVMGVDWSAVANPSPDVTLGIWDAGAGAGPLLSRADTLRLAIFALRLSGCDLVAAARKVVEAHQRYKSAEEATHAWAAYEKAASDRHDALDVFSAELAKLDGEEGGGL